MAQPDSKRETPRDINEADLSRSSLGRLTSREEALVMLKEHSRAFAKHVIAAGNEGAHRQQVLDIRSELQAICSFDRINVGESIPWDGPLHEWSKLLAAGFQPDERLTAGFLERELEQDRDLLYVITSIGLRLGIEQGRKSFIRDTTEDVDLMIDAILILEGRETNPSTQERNAVLDAELVVKKASPSEWPQHDLPHDPNVLAKALASAALQGFKIRQDGQLVRSKSKVAELFMPVIERGIEQGMALYASEYATSILKATEEFFKAEDDAELLSYSIARMRNELALYEKIGLRRNTRRIIERDPIAELEAL